MCSGQVWLALFGSAVQRTVESQWVFAGFVVVGGVVVVVVGVCAVVGVTSTSMVAMRHRCANMVGYNCIWIRRNL